MSKTLSVCSAAFKDLKGRDVPWKPPQIAQEVLHLQLSTQLESSRTTGYESAPAPCD